MSSDQTPPPPPRVTMRMKSSRYQCWVNCQDGRRRLKTCRTRLKHAAREYAELLQVHLLKTPPTPPATEVQQDDLIPPTDIPAASLGKLTD